jgi:hypothetical protein
MANKLTHVHSENGYSFYIGTVTEKGGFRTTVYNILPSDHQAPSVGYPNRKYIEGIKGVKFPDRYQPTKHGMTELYPNG